MEIRHIIELFILAVSMSTDSFVLGISYGMKQIKIPLDSCLIIGVMSGILLGAGILAGEWIALFWTEEQLRWTGAFLMVGMGIWYLAEGLLKKGEELDLDNSRKLEKKEAILLGLVLSADGSAIGVGSVMLNVSSPVLVALVCVSQIVFLQTGLLIGGKRTGEMVRTGVLPGILFLLLGIGKLLV